LGKDVSPVNLDEHPELETMVLPVDAIVCESEGEIQSACTAILESMPDEPAVMHIGFDMEWDFSVGQSGGPRTTALVQIALPNIVYLLRTCSLRRLPKSLLLILTNTRLVKIGRNINSDLKKLARDFPELKLPLTEHKMLDGTIELGALAKAKNVVSEATASLSAITAAALHCHLSKECRVSEWSAPKLSEEQVQ
jgi:hypothetical protein